MHILSSVPDPRFGGPQQRSLAVARELRDYDITTSFLVPKGPGTFGKEAHDEGFRVWRVRVPRIRSPKQILENMRFIAGYRSARDEVQRLIETNDIDVVHVNGPLNFPVATAANRSNAALLWHFNDTLTPTPLRQLAGMAAKRWADDIVVAANAVHDHFFSDRTETRTIYAPVDIDEFDPHRHSTASQDLRDEFGLCSSTDIICTVGNLNPVKGHKYLVEAFAEVVQRFDTHLLIVGKSLESRREYYEKIQRQVGNLGIDDDVTFAGWRSDVPKILAGSDLFVLASLSEACPIVVLEAMAMRRATIVTNVGGIPEQIPDSDHGWVVPPANPNALADAIFDALSNPQDRQRRATNARSRAGEVFSLEVCVQHHVDAYRAAISTADSEPQVL